MVDSGLTLHYIMRSAQPRAPSLIGSVHTLRSPHLRLVDMNIRYRGFEVPDDFFVGTGSTTVNRSATYPPCIFAIGTGPADALLMTPTPVTAIPITCFHLETRISRPTCGWPQASICPLGNRRQSTATTSNKLAPGLGVGHGAGSQAARHEAFCLEACSHGFAVLALDFRGHGHSDGTADGPLEQDVLAAVRFLRAHPSVDEKTICYRGSSMGAFYGLKAAPKRDFAAMPCSPRRQDGYYMRSPTRTAKTSKAPRREEKRPKSLRTH